jgi:hypothetical protein
MTIHEDDQKHTTHFTHETKLLNSFGNMIHPR